MKKKINNKKLLSITAVVALSVTAVCGTVGALGNKNKSNYTPSESVASNGKYSTISTAVGAVRSVSSGKVYYVSNTATERDSNSDGSKDKPFHIRDALMAGTDGEYKLKPGDTLYVLPGEYKLALGLKMEKLSGEYNKYIRIVNAALEPEQSGYTGTDKKVILNFSEMHFNSVNRGVEIYGDYIYWYGIDVCGAGDNGLYIGGKYNTIEYSEFYNNRDTGLQLGRSYSEYNTIDKWPSYNLVKNCTSHNNYDNETFGENADGFAAKLTVGYGNVFDGCIAYRNSDDGWDLYAKADSGNIGVVIMYNCVAFENGYLEYTREQTNSLFKNYNTTFDAGETRQNPYMTRDGDGNGFKLGGSVMEGDVLVYNCLAFNNRMHGVTDNSNPGFLKVQGVTSYNNSATIDMNGKIAGNIKNLDDPCANIDLARQTFSYNSISGILSIREDALTAYGTKNNLDADNMRGTIVNSLLTTLKTSSDGVVEAGSIKTLVYKGAYDVGGVGESKDLVTSANMFKQVPVVVGTDGNTYNLDGVDNSMVFEDIAKTNETDRQLRKVTSLKDTRVHVTYRNADQSINMGDILAKSDSGVETIKNYIGENIKVGSDLNKGTWADYDHFYTTDLANGEASNKDKATAQRVKDALTINCEEQAVHQDFDVPSKMDGATISWASSDPEHLVVTTDIVKSSSGTESIKLVVWRDATEDKQVTLTATIKSGNETETKEFTLTVKKGTPRVGAIYVVDKSGTVVKDGGEFNRYIIDRYNVLSEPQVKVKNGLYLDSDKLLKDDEYKLETVYMYQKDANAAAVQIKEFTPSVAGVYTIKHTVKIESNNSVNTMSYRIYVASVDATVDFTSPATVSVYQNGYMIAGEPSSATGAIISVTSPTAITDLTAETIKNHKDAVISKFRDTSIKFEFKNANKTGYFVYYALTNANGKVTSQVYSVEIKKVDIDSTDKFMKIAGGLTIGDENPSQTIYALTADLDFTGVTFAREANNFSGLFNGLGHKISNLTIDRGDAAEKNIGVFYKVAGGTIMNTKFDKVTIKSAKGLEKLGFVSECTGGYFYNLAFTELNIDAPTAARVGGLIGHVGGTTDGLGAVYPLFISQVSIVNGTDSKLVGSTRVAGLVGYVQHYRNAIAIDNCYVVTNIAADGKGEGSGIVASWEDNYAPDSLTIERCYYAGQLKTEVNPGSSRLGGMLGYHKGGKGKLVIKHCISLATIQIQQVLNNASIKNASPIVGNSASNADVVVDCCIGLMQEYNTMYNVEIFTETNLKQNTNYIEDEYYLNLDIKTRWKVVAADANTNNEKYKAPYLILNFLEV